MHATSPASGAIEYPGEYISLYTTGLLFSNMCVLCLCGPVDTCNMYSAVFRKLDNLYVQS